MGIYSEDRILEDELLVHILVKTFKLNEVTLAVQYVRYPHTADHIRISSIIV
uniref:Uncharacterized protein n=1 Tax=Rhizophagus irregularis (strain DAOM 181602 / DAOM 197198 / MUCL 43194) TaxID=747089 RepID=U9UE83_RHIID